MKTSIQKLVLAGLALAVLPMNGCLFGTATRGARSLGLGQRSLSAGLNYWTVDSHQVEAAGNTVTRRQEERTHYFDGMLDLRLGTRIPGLDMGLGINIPSGLGFDFRYQFLGFNKNPESFAASAGAEFNMDWLSGVGIAGTLAVAHDIGIGDLSLGGRVGRVTHERDPQEYNDRRNNSYYFNKGYSIDPANYTYTDLFASLEMRVLDRLGVVFGGMWRQFVEPTSFNNVSGSRRMETTFPGMAVVSIGLRHYGGRIESGTAVPSIKKRIEEGRRLSKAGKHEEALELLLPAHDSAPNNYDLLLALAFSHYKLGHMKKALEFYEDALRQDPGNPRLQKTVLDIRDKISSGEIPGDSEDEDFMP